MSNQTVVPIDASKFPGLIARVAETMAQKVKREGHERLSAPSWFHPDIFISLRQAKNVYDFLFWTHSDELRSHYGWRDNYIFAAAPLVRTLIDILFNVTLLLQDPHRNGARFHASGLRKSLLMLDEEQARYGGTLIWDEWIDESRQKISLLLARFGFSEAAVRDKKTYPDWPTLGKYLAQGQETSHKNFFKTFSYGRWKRYSAIAHGAAEGLQEIGSFLNYDGHVHERRHEIDESYPLMMTYYILDASVLLLSIVTEVQAVYKFRDTRARVDERLVEGWQALLPSMEGREIYDHHYLPLMKQTGIHPRGRSEIPGAPGSSIGPGLPDTKA